MANEPQWLTEFKKKPTMYGGIFADLLPTVKTLQAGLILWSGNQLDASKAKLSKDDVWWGFGQLGGKRPLITPTFTIKYFGVDIEAAKSYAQCATPRTGWLHEFKLMKPIRVLNIGSLEHLEWDEMVELCQLAFEHGISGVFVNWGVDKGEVALCSWIPELAYIASARCIGRRVFTPLYDAIM